MMHPALNIMLERYSCKTLNDYTNALKEIIQEISLLGLWRAKFFEHAAFYGGTALRIFHGLPRFSEDLDFSLLKPNPNFKLNSYNNAIAAELQSFGFKVEIVSKIKRKDSQIDSVTVKANTKIQLLAISTPKDFLDSLHSDNAIKVKMEIDTDPPQGFQTESQLLLNPIPFEVNVYQKMDLFATKVHALLCRSWEKRVKGRDWFDFIWYIGRGVPLHLSHLEARLRTGGQWQSDKKLDVEAFNSIMRDKINEINFERAKEDVIPFIVDKAMLNLWSKDFFKKIMKDIQFQ